MENSLNSSRNFKLPPIQGAAPAANILRQPATRGNQTWPLEYGQRSSHRSASRQVIHVPGDPFPDRYRSPRHVSHNLSNVAGQRRAFNSVVIENEMSRGESLTLEFAPMVHNFPQTYTVLPPIQKISKPPFNESGIASYDKPLRCEEEKNVRAKSIDDVGKPSNRDKADDGRKLHVNESGDLNTNNKTDLGNGENVPNKKRKTDPRIQDSETGERKRSATTVLFLKGKRTGRRVGVCLENEPALINVTEQLKEIFLRRNMEEMYLI